MSLAHLAALTGNRVSLRRNTSQHHEQRSVSARFKVIRFDGVLLGGAMSLERAEAMAAVLRTGQRRDFAQAVAR